jgi:mannose-1-phosphate guanylyltransferase
MKALILVGGYGTRLRPLTFSVPKPLVPFANMPIVMHQIEALARVGVKDIILAVNYEPEAMKDFLKDAEKKLGINIHFSKEDEPLGTAGPISLASKFLLADNEPFFMFNSDVICEFPLEAMLRFHKAHKKEGTIMVTPVDDPSKYGVVLYDKDGKIEAFIEKPKVPVSNKINAGMYLFNVDIVKRIQPKPTSIEREIFPVMAKEGNLFAMDLPGYWMDIGQPKDFLTGSCLHLKSLDDRKDSRVRPKIDGVVFEGSNLVDSTAEIEAGAVIGPNVVIGPKCKVAAGARIQRSALFAGAKVKAHAFVQNSIVGWESRIGQWAHVDGAVLGKDVGVADGVVLIGTTICPHKDQKENDFAAKTIL